MPRQRRTVYINSRIIEAEFYADGAVMDSLVTVVPSLMLPGERSASELGYNMTVGA